MLSSILRPKYNFYIGVKDPKIKIPWSAGNANDCTLWFIVFNFSKKWQLTCSPSSFLHSNGSVTFFTWGLGHRSPQGLGHLKTVLNLVETVYLNSQTCTEYSFSEHNTNALICYTFCALAINLYFFFFWGTVVVATPEINCCWRSSCNATMLTCSMHLLSHLVQSVCLQECLGKLSIVCIN